MWTKVRTPCCDCNRHRATEALRPRPWSLGALKLRAAPCSLRTASCADSHCHACARSTRLGRPAPPACTTGAEALPGLTTAALHTLSKFDIIGDTDNLTVFTNGLSQMLQLRVAKQNMLACALDAIECTTATKPRAACAQLRRWCSEHVVGPLAWPPACVQPRARWRPSSQPHREDTCGQLPKPPPRRTRALAPARRPYLGRRRLPHRHSNVSHRYELDRGDWEWIARHTTADESLYTYRHAGQQCRGDTA